MTLRAMAALFLCAVHLLAEPEENALARARELTRTKQYSKALSLLESHLKSEPDDTDARVYYGIVLSWEARYDEARTQLRQVLAGNPNHGDALLALANLELWSDHPEQTERLTSAALERRGASADLMYARARALKAMNRERDAMDVLNQLLQLEPQHADALRTRSSLQDSMRHWEAQWSYSYEWFNKNLDGWHEAQMGLKRATPAGSVIARFSRADRFGLHSNQAEIDFYPRIRKGTYGYVNVGYSYDATLYPQYRLGADLFQSLGGGFEASGGLRRLGFSSKVNIYTTSLGKYYGSWFFNGRAYLTPDSAGTSRSVHLSARRYFGEATDYIGFRVGRGAAPIETRTLGDIEILNSTSVYAELNKSLGRRWMMNFRAGHGREDRLNRGVLHRYLAESSIYLRF